MAQFQWPVAQPGQKWTLTAPIRKQPRIRIPKQLTKVDNKRVLRPESGVTNLGFETSTGDVTLEEWAEKMLLSHYKLFQKKRKLEQDNFRKTMVSKGRFP